MGLQYAKTADIIPAPINNNNNNRRTAPEVSAAEITLAIEFLTTSLRAIVEGHDNGSSFVTDPLLWAYSKIKEQAEPVITHKSG